MKMVSLAEQILKYMVKEFASANTDIFSFSDIKEKFPGYTDEYLTKAIYLLEYDGFVYVSPSDDVAYTSYLLPDGIRNCEENTLLKKGYGLLKEIKTLLP